MQQKQSVRLRAKNKLAETGSCWPSGRPQATTCPGGHSCPVRREKYPQYETFKVGDDEWKILYNKDFE